MSIHITDTVEIVGCYKTLLNFLFIYFQKFHKTRESTLFYNLEIHVAEPIDTNRSDCCRYRVYSHYGSTQDLEVRNKDMLC